MYDPFGNIKSSTGSVSNNYLFNTQQRDPEYGLYYLRARHYDPTVGRFISRDPVQGALTLPQSLNPYSYALNDPINLSDPSGLFPDYILDAITIAYDLACDPASLPADIVLGLIPFVPAGITKVGKVINKSTDVLKWRNEATLLRHFQDHASDFGAKTPNEYAKMASEFLRNAQKQGLPTKIDPTDGTIRVYDSKTNTFGAYNADGTTKTFFKPDPAKHGLPSNIDYWNKQLGN